MKRYLLDTHLVYWWMTADARLGKATQRIIAKSEIVVSAAAAILVDDIRGRFIWGSLIYGFQMVLITHALLSNQETRAGRAWRLLLGGIAMIVLVLPPSHCPATVNI